MAVRARCEENRIKTGTPMTEAIDPNAPAPARAPVSAHSVPRAHPEMIYLKGGAFLMGSEHHYPEERPVHKVRVDGFWIDRTPVTNREFRRFVEATRYVTFAEIPPDPKDYPGAL